MQAALREAEVAAEEEEAPIGAVVVHENRVIGRGHNRTRALHDPTAHAEILAISAAAESLGDWRLENCDLYVTIEPCVMCAGAAVLARLRQIYYGAREPKFGGCGSIFDIPSDSRLNHRVGITGGILGDNAVELMQAFFRKVREEKKTV